MDTETYVLLIVLVLGIMTVMSLFLFIVYWCFVIIVHYLYERAHIKRAADGSIELHEVWWGRYFGYK